MTLLQGSSAFSLAALAPHFRALGLPAPTGGWSVEGRRELAAAIAATLAGAYGAAPPSPTFGLTVRVLACSSFDGNAYDQPCGADFATVYVMMAGLVCPTECSGAPVYKSTYYSNVRSEGGARR